MRALVLNSHGGVENFTLEDIGRPDIGCGRVLVKVASASLNQIDNKIRHGLPIGPDLPAVLGCDFAGVIEEIGDQVEGYAIGDEVFGCAGGVKGHGGSLAEYISCDYRLIARKPARLTMRQAAALPLVSITAWEAIERARISSSDHVLVHAGAGGVGHIAVQLAQRTGAKVTATVGDDAGASLARSFGASNVVFYRSETPSDYSKRLTGGKGFSVIIDTVGGENLERSFEAAGLNGRISTTASRVKADLSPLHAKALSLYVVFMLLPMLSNVGREKHGAILRQIATLADHGHLRPLIDPSRFVLSSAAEAYAYLEGGTAKGKVVVDIESRAA
ncbi:zinc-dependent alcohol dehydrogenase family protein [Ochrobactrum soli]|uniref:Bifunctional protein: zinc-containing alcohol dehydrogenase quinone oxidoreductase ( NADPH:quinone reductase) Similar to arginate lyase n=1 Tax=Ochrobactrum soli TaxID=2448455 RepID=A0A2P9HEA5_9HYPH|nr:zinc-dependent alcohol dehydrogenase family protein [[Ochrobactrum] soli]SPL62428.1 Bifunctional protein: zinc-containing alcohol dehydrogenase; quinone oxidoreductase (NADPH:quinone reductase); Similar to arginate lyase [[Ochrobactrum] soli]